MKLGMYTKVVKFYPYRTARMVHDQMFLRLNRHSEEMRELEQYLSNKLNVTADNHTVYKLEKKDGGELYIQFTDSEVNFGSDIIEERW